jgi:hypothetical protein
MKDDTSDVRTISITVVAEETFKAHLGDVGLFIYDFDSLYELVRMAVDPKYAGYTFSRFSLYRNGRPLDEEDQLRVEQLNLSSPLEIAGDIAVYGTAASAVLGSLYLLVQLLEKISNFHLHKEKLELEAEKLRKELDEENLNLIEHDADALQDQVAARGAEDYISQVSRRLERSSIEIVDITFEVRE